MSNAQFPVRLHSRIDRDTAEWLASEAKRRNVSRDALVRTIIGQARMAHRPDPALEGCETRDASGSEAAMKRAKPWRSR